MLSSCSFFQRQKKTEIPLRELSGQSDSIQAIPESHNPFVYTVTRNAGYFSLTTLIPYGYFTYGFARDAIVLIGTQVGIQQSTMTSMAIAPSAILTAFDSIANISLVDFHTAALNWSKSLRDGFLTGSARHIQKMFRSPKAFFTVGIPTLAIAISYPIGGYTNGILLQKQLEEMMGLWCWGPLAALALTSSMYLIITQAPDNLRGVKFYLNEGKQRLMPEQNSLLYHLLFGNMNIKATAIQCALFEMLPGNISRAIGGGFLAGKLAEQLNLSHNVARGSELAMMVISLFGFYFARAPLAYKKYFGTKTNPLYLVTQAERDQMHTEHYANLSWIDFFKKELKRLALPLPIAQLLLSFYLGSVLPIPYVLPVITGAISAFLFHTQIYRRANLTLELNQLALLNETISERITAIITANNTSSTTTPSAQQHDIHSLALLLAQVIASLAWAARSLGSVPMTKTMLNNWVTLESRDELLISLSLGIITAINGYQYFLHKISMTMDTWFSSYFRSRQQSPSNLIIEEVTQQPEATSHPIDIAEIASETKTETTPLQGATVTPISIFQTTVSQQPDMPSPQPRKSPFECGIM